MSSNHREGGYTFELNEPAESTELDQLLSDTRESKTFAIDDDVPESIPQSITSNERLPNVSQLSSFKLEALPIKGLKVFFYAALALVVVDRKSTRLNSSHVRISYAVFCLKKKTYI